MTGSLSRLILRARGELPVAAPLIPSRYAPSAPQGTAPPWEPAAEETLWVDRAETAASLADVAPSAGLAFAAARGAADRTAAAGPVRPPAAAPALDRDETARLPEAVDRPPVLQAAPNGQPVPLETRLDTATASERRPVDASPPPTPVPAQAKGPALAGDASAAPVEDAAPPRPTLLAPSMVSPRAEIRSAIPIRTAGIAPEAPPDVRQGAPAAARPPDVRITIGRVEVHATPPPVTRARVATRRPPLSLADYLAQRK